MARPTLSAAATAVALAVGLAACGQTVRSNAPTAQQVAAAFAGAPPQLAALHQQANRLLSASPAAVQARLAALHGSPVIVNKWASWCVPCRGEFPVFQQVAVKLGRQVAFVGLDSGDNRGDASAFLRRFPVTYPSYVDPNERVAYALNASAFYPTTLFYDTSGKLAFAHQGGYATQAALLTDIHRYLHV
jgi:thiol-disulfide isomerase/thioredoxin